MSKPQTEQQVAGDYRLDVTDFGPIAKASVDLRPLTVFIGPSNTGKSYLAILMYALHQCFGDSDFLPYRGIFPRYRGWPIRGLSEVVRDRAPIRRSLQDWISKGGLQKDSLSTLPADVAAHIYSILARAKDLDRYLEQEICRCFGVDRLDELVRRQGPHAHISIGVSRNGRETVRYQLEFDQKGPRLQGQLSETIPPATKIFNEIARNRWGRIDNAENMNEDDIDSLFRLLAQSVFSSLLQPVRRAAYYLPADRTGLAAPDLERIRSLYDS